MEQSFRLKGHISAEQARKLLSQQDDKPIPNWWILCGSLVFVAFTLASFGGALYVLRRQGD